MREVADSEVAVTEAEGTAVVVTEAEGRVEAVGWRR